MPRYASRRTQQQRGGDFGARQRALVLLTAACFGSAAETASPAGLSMRGPSAMARFITAPMRCRTRLAVTRLVDQNGDSTVMPSAVVTASTVLSPMRGKA